MRYRGCPPALSVRFDVFVVVKGQVSFLFERGILLYMTQYRAHCHNVFKDATINVAFHFRARSILPSPKERAEEKMRVRRKTRCSMQGMAFSSLCRFQHLAFGVSADGLVGPCVANRIGGRLNVGRRGGNGSRRLHYVKSKPTCIGRPGLVSRMC